MSLAFIPSLRPLRVTRGGATCRVKKVITADAKKRSFSSSRYSGSHYGKTKPDSEEKEKIPKKYAHSGRYHVGYQRTDAKMPFHDTERDADPEPAKKGIPKRHAHSGRYHVGYEVSRPDVDMIHDGGDHVTEAHKNQSKGIPRRYATSSRYHVGYEVSRPDVDMIHDKGMHEFVAHAAPAVSPPFKPRKSFASSSRYGGNRVGLSSSRAEKKRVDEAKRYAWARRDQEEALKALKSTKSTRAAASGDIKPARVTKYVGANPHHDKYFDWEKEDQRLNIVNEVIDRHLRDADEECQVNWIHGMFSGGHEEECVRDVDAIMSIVAKHTDLAEAVAVVRELVDRGGSSAANAVRTWCAAHANLPNATALSGMLDDMSKGKSIGTPSN